jgi:hypothetical protein
MYINRGTMKVDDRKQEESHYVEQTVVYAVDWVILKLIQKTHGEGNIL